MGCQPSGLVGAQAGVVFLQARRHASHTVVVAHELRLLQFVQPAYQAVWGFFGRCCGQAKTFQVDQAANACGPCATVTHHHVAAHAVAQQVHRGVGAEGVDEPVQVPHIVGEPVTVARGRGGQAEATPAWGNDVSGRPFDGGQGVHHKLERSAHVHPAVHQHHGGLTWRGHGGVAPHLGVVVQTANGNEAALWCAQ